MYKKIEFIGREKELQAIQSWIDTPKENSIIFLEAEGGIGKTRMLKEIEEHYASSKDVIVSAIVDYDEHRYFTVNTMRDAIITKVGEKYFTKYRILEKESVFNKERLNDKFTQEFNHYERISNKKIVLLIDTAEKAQNSLFWNDFRGSMRPFRISCQPPIVDEIVS